MTCDVFLKPSQSLFRHDTTIPQPHAPETNLKRLRNRKQDDECGYCAAFIADVGRHRHVRRVPFYCVGLLFDIATIGGANRVRILGGNSFVIAATTTASSMH